MEEIDRTAFDQERQKSLRAYQEKAQEFSDALRANLAGSRRFVVQDEGEGSIANRDEEEGLKDSTLEDASPDTEG